MEKIEIDAVIDEVKEILKDKILYKKEEILGKIECDKKDLNSSMGIIYIFINKRTGKVLKIGKDTSENKKRFRITHYSIDGAQSTLAKDLYNDYVEKEEKSILYNLREEDKIKLNELRDKIIQKKNDNKKGKIYNEINKVNELKEDEKTNKYFKEAREVVRKWMRNEDNIETHTIFLPKGLNIFILNFFEAYFQLKYNPKFEGNKNQNIGE